MLIIGEFLHPEVYYLPKQFDKVLRYWPKVGKFV